MYEEKGELEKKIEKHFQEEQQLQEKNEKLQEELRNVYNSKRWKYTEKLSNFFHNKN